MKIELAYFGRPSEFLMMTSESMIIPERSCTLGQVLNRLRERGDRWVYELDDSHVICTVERKSAMPAETLVDGDEIGIFSRRSLFEI
ncbi:MAG: hypothetical protein GJU76_01550 [Gallionella sp.]|jgi:molybdopterin converting factor small subunit|nr:hypothetical protein [Gallionella sp.]